MVRLKVPMSAMPLYTPQLWCAHPSTPMIIAEDGPYEYKCACGVITEFKVFTGYNDNEKTIY